MSRKARRTGVQKEEDFDRMMAANPGHLAPRTSQPGPEENPPQFKVTCLVCTTGLDRLHEFTCGPTKNDILPIEWQLRIIKTIVTNYSNWTCRQHALVTHISMCQYILLVHTMCFGCWGLASMWISAQCTSAHCSMHFSTCNACTMCTCLATLQQYMCVGGLAGLTFRKNIFLIFLL